MTSLYEYQIEGAKWLASVGRGLLADEPGLGKTAQAIEACNLTGAKYVAVVCPASVVLNWRREISMWSNYGWDYEVMSYDGVRLGKLDPQAKLWGFDAVILDEAHYLKNPEAQRTKRILGDQLDGVGGIIEGVRNVFALTGTPYSNSPEDLWPLSRALFPSSMVNSNGDLMNRWQFRHRFCKVDMSGRVVGAKNLSGLRRRLAPHFMRRDSSIVNLPPLRSTMLPVAGSDKTFVDLPDYRRAVAAWCRGGLAALEEEALHLATLRRLIGVAKVPGVASWAKDFLDGSDKKLVLFGYHRDVIQSLEREMKAHGYKVSYVDGTTPQSMRQAQVDLFQIDPDRRVFIGQITAAGVGITLTAASDMVIVEPMWTPDHNIQAALRIRRIGQKNVCIVRFASLHNSLDWVIQSTAARKLAESREIFC